MKSLIIHKLELVLRGLSYIRVMIIVFAVQFKLAKMHSRDQVVMFVG